MYKLPDRLFTWALKPWFANEGHVETDSGLILPFKDESTEPSMVYWSRMEKGGTQRCWLWLFPNRIEATAVSCIPQYAETPETALIEATLPRASKFGDPRQILEIDPDWLSSQPLAEMDIHEVWIGFDYKSFARDRILRVATTAVMSVDEFCAIASR